MMVSWAFASELAARPLPVNGHAAYAAVPSRGLSRAL